MMEVAGAPFDIDAIMDRFEAPLYREGPASGVGGEWTATVHNPRCGDVISMHAAPGAGGALRVRWQGHGCTLSVVGADVAAELADGQVAETVLGWRDDEVTRVLGLELVGARRECATLGPRALRLAIATGSGVTG